MPAGRKLLSSAAFGRQGQMFRVSRGGGKSLRAKALGGRGGCEAEDEAC